MTEQTEPLRIVPIYSFREAVAWIAAHHRHNKPPRGMKFAIGVARGDRLVGIATVGRPVAASYDDGMTLEVNRTTVLEDQRNANSMLYGAAWRAAKALGYRRLITYTQADESGASLRGAGWIVIAQRPARAGWTTPARPRDDHGTDDIPRTLWEAPS